MKSRQNDTCVDDCITAIKRNMRKDWRLQTESRINLRYVHHTRHRRIGSGNKKSLMSESSG